MTPLLLVLLMDAGAPQVVEPSEPAIALEETKPPDDALDIDPLEPDFVVVNLPTTARLPKGKLAFRVTHRFADGIEGSDLGSLFSLDGGAQTGLELRYGLLGATQLWIHRTSDRTIAFHVTQGLLRQPDAPLALQADLSVEGLDNFSEEYSPRIGVTLSRRLGERVALYVAPAFVGNTNLFGTDEEDDSSVVLGLGARLRITETLSLLAEAHPRLAGYDADGDPLVAFGFEGRVGGHCFQFNVGTDLGTTPAQVARGHIGPDNWYIGFNIARKFY